MENVVFTGAVPPAKIPDFLNASKVFVMASRAEGLPNSMIEAMSCGLPVIVPNVDDVTSLAIHEKNALVLEKVTPENIAEAVCRLIQDKRLFQNLQKGVTDTREQLRKECSLDAVKKIWAEALDLTETEEQFSS